jgi:hypothetical protein
MPWDLLEERAEAEALALVEKEQKEKETINRPSSAKF